MNIHALPHLLYSCEQVREMDRAAIAQGTPGIVLMKRAASAAFELLLCEWPDCKEIIVLCGSGNNAGDGYILAGLAAQECVPVKVFYVSPPENLFGDARSAYNFALQEGVSCQSFAEFTGAYILSEESIFVDALLGIGINKPVSGDYAKAIKWMNESDIPVLSLDVPSGLCANTGVVFGCAVDAAVTLTFIGLKKGLLTGQASSYCGKLLFASLGVNPRDVTLSSGCMSSLITRRLDIADVIKYLPSRRGSDHKGKFGHLSLVGGDNGMGGAILMAAEASFSCGIGLVSVVTHPHNVTAALIRLPEAMARGVADTHDLVDITEPLRSATAFVIGPGMGRRDWAKRLLVAALEKQLPMVLDADGLNFLAEAHRAHSAKKTSLDLDVPIYSDHWVLTPHPGEAARLLQTDILTIEQDRFVAVSALQKRYGGVVVLKGAGTLVADKTGVFVCPYGNPSMATAGMGDVLSGIIGAFLVQGLSLLDAACLGVCVHALAADQEVAVHGPVGLRSTAIFPYIRQILNTNYYA